MKMTGFWALLWILVMMNCQCAEIFSNECRGDSSESSESSPCDLDDDDLVIPTTHIVWPTPPHISTESTILPSTQRPASTLIPQCSEKNQTVGDRLIIWPRTEMGSNAVSDPPCLNESLSLVKRHCDLEWEDPPTCNSFQQPINPCPSGLNSIGSNDRYCYTIIETKFPPDCPYPGPLGWDDYVNLDLFGSEPVWMPLRRTTSARYGIDLLRYTELTQRYDSPFQICTQSCRTFFYQDTFLDKECQVYHNSTHVEAVSCDAEYAAVCMYDALPYKASSLCAQTYPNCKQGDYKPDSICFCETSSQTVGEPVLANFLLPYQNLIFPNDSCRFGLRNTFASSTIPFIWTNSSMPINYTYWAPNVDFSYENGILNADGWTLSNENFDCVLYQLGIPIQAGKLNLYIENETYRLEITNYKSFLSWNNSDPVIHCFTDADAKSIIYPVSNFTEVSNTSKDYMLKFPSINVDQSGPGHYWCQAFVYPNLEVITSEARIILNFSAEYVVLFKLKDYDEKLSFYPLTPENLETLQNLFRNELPSTVSFYPRIFKINNIDETRKEMSITFHLTSADGSNTEDEHNYLKSICMEQSMFEFLDFRNVHYCPNSTTQHGGQTIVWPLMTWTQTTNNPWLNGEVPGYCVTSNGTLIQRTCIGNFIDGVYWSEMSDFCLFYPGSHLTPRLINITNRNYDETLTSSLTELQEISKEYGSFNTLDLVLTANFIMDISVRKPDLNLLTEIVSNLMSISRAVLLSAQLNFKATDIILKAVDDALENGDFGEWNNPNFAVNSVDISEGIVGFQIRNCVNYSNCVLEPIVDSSVLYNNTFIIIENVDTAVSLSSELYQQIIDYSNSNNSYSPKLIVSVFFGSQLFVELENSKFSDLVIGVLLPDFTNSFKGPVSIYYYTNLKNRSLEYNCSYWKFNDKYSSSWTIENTDELTEVVACEFYHITHFGIPVLIPEAHRNMGADTQKVCIPDDEVAKKCFNANQYDSDLLCKGINIGDTLDKFCLTGNLTVIPTNCFENFTGENHVSEIFGNCSVHELSTSMKQLFQEDTADSILDLLLDLTASSQSLTDFELLFAASFLEVASNQTLNMSKLAGIVNNLMEVPRPVMYRAQLKYRVVDTLLSTIEEALINGECGEWKTEQFVIKCLEIDEEHVGVFLKNCSQDLKDCDLEVIERSDLPNNADFSSEEIYAVITLSDVLCDQILNYSKTNSSYSPKLMISIYYSSALFVDIEAATPISNFVFSVLLPYFEEDFQGPLLIYYVKSGDSIQYNCSYWKFDEINYGTWIVEASLLSDQAVVCEFYHLTNFALQIRGLNSTYLAKSEVDSYFSFDTILLQKANSFNVPSSGFSLMKDQQSFFVSQEDQAMDFNEIHENEIRRHGVCEHIPEVDAFYNVVLTQAKVSSPNVQLLLSNLDDNLERKISMSEKHPCKGKCFYRDHEIAKNALRARSGGDIHTNVVTCNFQHMTHFALVANSHNITTDLEQILASNLTGLEKLRQVESITASNHNNLVAVDIYLISQIITYSLTEGAIPSIITRIISSLFMVPRSVLMESQEIHAATDIILYAVDEMSGMVNDFDTHLQNFSLIVKNLDRTNLTGVILSGCDKFLCTVTQLRDFVNISDYTGNESVSAMVTFSEELVAQIKNYTSNPKVVISIYYSDVLFNEVGNTRKTTKIFGISFPGFDDLLNGTVSVVYNIGTTSTSDSNQCSYWNYTADPAGDIVNATLGGWASDPNKQRENTMVICNFTHVTHFGMLLGDTDEYDDDAILDLITDIGCFLSLFGVFLIIITAILFKKWRQNTGNKILINFSIAISVKIITLYVSVYVKTISYGITCTITGIALHYAILSECAWMLTVAILQFKRFVEVLGGPPKYVLVKALICGWIFPIIPVICVISIDPDNYERGVANLCYPSNLGLYLGVWLPVLLILSINCIIFTFIIYNVFHKKTEYIDTSNHEMLFQWRLALLLFFMLGLNWAFGFLGQIKGDLFFTYLYSVTASLQGFVLFLFFIVFNKNTRFMYSQAIKQWFYARGIFKVRNSKSKSNPKY